MTYRKPPPPDTYQSQDDVARAIAEKFIADTKSLFARAFRTYRTEILIDEVEADIARGDFIGAARRISESVAASIFADALIGVTDTYYAAGVAGAGQISALQNQAAGYRVADKFAFNLYTKEIFAELAAYQTKFLTDMTADMRQNVFDTINMGVRAGRTPQELARTIREGIGLSDRQAKAVASYRAGLENASADPASRKLRDPAGDEQVHAAAESGQPLSPKKINALVDAYVERSIDGRAAMIAQTESTRAANMGLKAAYQQAVTRGVFPHAAVKQHWKLDLDERTCLVCIGIAAMNVGGIAIDAMFDSVEGPIEQPPVHNHCRCSIEMRTNLDMVTVPGTVIAEAMS